MKTIIIDGNNLIHKIKNLKAQFAVDPKGAAISLIEIVRSRSQSNARTIFVFDGYGSIANKNVIFSKQLSADEVIRKYIEEFPTHKNLKVISSDIHITSLAKACGCEIQKSEEFRNSLEKKNSPASGKNINQNYIYDKPEKPERMSRKEVDEFKKYFS